MEEPLSTEQSDELRQSTQTNGNGHELPREDKIILAFRKKGRTYYELMQLTLALKALSDWRQAEDEFLP